MVWVWFGAVIGIDFGYCFDLPSGRRPPESRISAADVEEKFSFVSIAVVTDGCRCQDIGMGHFIRSTRVESGVYVDEVDGI